MIYTRSDRPAVGAVLTQNNLLGQSFLLGTICGTTDQDRGLAHSFPFLRRGQYALRHPVCQRRPDGQLFRGRYFQPLKEKSPIAAVPRLFIGMVMQSEEKHFDLVPKNFVSAARGYADEFSPLQSRFGFESARYTPAEACQSVLTRPAGIHKPGSVGPVVPDVEARVVDDAGRELPTGRSENSHPQQCHAGYYQDEAATAAVIRAAGFIRAIWHGSMRMAIFLTGLKSG